ncbi:MAG: ABC transporter substrate-binding protein [Alphaproteobacteria bacterium]
MVISVFKRVAIRVLVACSLAGLCCLLVWRLVFGVVDSGRYSGTIIISTNGDPNRAAGFKKLIKAYNEIRPDVQILLELKGGGSRLGGEYPIWLTAQMGSGKPRPDIVSSNYAVNAGRYVNFNYYRDVINPHTQRPWDEDIDFDWHASINAKGERIMMPGQAVHVMWYYNKDIFEKLNLKPPKTWREFMELCAKIKAAGHTPTTLYFTLHYYQWLAEILWDQYCRDLINIVRALPGDWCHDPEIDGKWRYDPTDPFNDKIPTLNYARLIKIVRDGDVRYDTPRYIQFLRNFKEITQYAPSNFLAESAAARGIEPYDLFLKQQAVMHLDGTWALTLLYKDMEDLAARQETGQGDVALKPFRWGTFDTPPQTNSLVLAPIRSVESSAGPYVGVADKNQKQTDLVMDFVMFWLSPPGYQAFVDGAVEADYFNPAGRVMIRDVRIPPRYEKMLSQFKMIGNAEFRPSSPGFTGSSLLSTEVRGVLTDYISGKITVEQAAQNCQAIAEKGVPVKMKLFGLSKRFIDHPELDPNQ